MFCVFANEYIYKDSTLPQILEDISHLMGPLIPLFGTSGDVSSGFQSQSGQPYSYSCLAKVYLLHSLRFTSGVTPVDLLAASMAAELFSSR